MCGFVGYIRKDSGVVDLEELTSLASVLHHRGPDDEGSFIDGQVGMYHKRLSIIDLKQGQQPMTFDGCTIVFNGEIYNYIELRRDLKNLGYNFKTNSDTEVILRMYQEFGAECVNFLNGMFALLIYDARKREIVIMRDHFGIKPLYFYEDKEKILFASEIKAILKHPTIVPEVHLKALHEYLTFQFVLGESTLFKDIWKVLPGHYKVLELETYKTINKKYWEPDFKIDNYHTEKYYVDELRVLLEDSVEKQLRSDVQVGCYLSGGLDSSIVALLAAKHMPTNMKTFTGAFREGPEFDETNYSREVGQVCNAEIFEIYPSENDFYDLLPKLIYHLDEPVAGPGLFPQYMVSKLASQNVKVVLGGQGGDEMFGGYARYLVAYLEQALKGAIFETNEEAEHIVSLQSILPNLPYLRQYIPMMKSFSNNEAFGPMDRRYFHLIDRSENSLKMFSDDFQNGFNRESVFQSFQVLFNNSNTLSYFNKMSHFDMFGSLPGLLQVEDRMSMAVSLESRVPLLDRRIVDLISAMPAGMKFKGANMKYLLKKSVQDLVPPNILNRRDKMGFPVPLHLWTKNRGRDFFRDILLSDQCKSRGIFKSEEIEKLINSERPFGRMLWGALSLELWHTIFIDN